MTWGGSEVTDPLVVWGGSEVTDAVGDFSGGPLLTRKDLVLSFCDRLQLPLLGEKLAMLWHTTLRNSITRKGPI